MKKLTRDEIVLELYLHFYENGILKTFEKTDYTRQNFYTALNLVYGENDAVFAYDLFILDAVKSGYVAS